MHCLAMFNLALGRSTEANRHHVQHCLGYLRALSLCASDLTLEPDDFSQRDFAVSDFEVTHECVDWAEIYDNVAHTNDGSTE
jgi:hypothetical protein